MSTCCWHLPTTILTSTLLPRPALHAAR
jgi:hypothetical protein